MYINSCSWNDSIWLLFQLIDMYKKLHQFVFFCVLPLVAMSWEKSSLLKWNAPSWTNPDMDASSLFSSRSGALCFCGVCKRPRIGWKQTDAASVIGPSRSRPHCLAPGQQWPDHRWRWKLDTWHDAHHTRLDKTKQFFPGLHATYEGFFLCWRCTTGMLAKWCLL